MSEEAPEDVPEAPKLKSKKGRLNKNLQPRPCSGCTEKLALHCRMLYMDVREFNESGPMPMISEQNQHFIYLFCSLECLRDFLNRAMKAGDNLNLK